MMTFPFPTGTRQMVLQFLQVKYLWAVSAWRQTGRFSPSRSTGGTCCSPPAACRGSWKTPGKWHRAAAPWPPSKARSPPAADADFESRTWTPRPAPAPPRWRPVPAGQSHCGRTSAAAVPFCTYTIHPSLQDSFSGGSRPPHFIFNYCTRKVPFRQPFPR